MLIEVIDKKIDLENDSKRIAITTLLNSFRMGNHIIVFEDEVLEEISISKHFGTNEKSYALQLKKKKKFFFHSLKLLIYKLRVDFSNDMNLINITENTINVSYKYCIDNILNPIKFLTENTIDLKLYKIITKFYINCELELIKGIKLSFEDAQGGGDGTKKRFDEFREKNILCLCLIDNDKKHPNGKKGQTILKFSSEDFLLNKTTLAYDIGVHEIENLIPCYIINKIMENSGKANFTQQQVETLDILKKLVCKNFEVKKYFDHKLGITSKNIIEWDKNHGDFWHPIITSLVKNNCLSSKECTCSSECKVLHGFSSNLLEKSIDYLDAESVGDFKKNLPDSMKDIWFNIAKIILGWGCSLEKIRC
ncbi:hypothetical protein QUR76_03875 [Arcobacter cryaerophilus gv. pseudocryaerophilus]|uniref:Uncharacterized protein n=3 Tax=unclassified Arcobacter TaxID=2593671 RepID=A0AA96RAT4_9BACT|nr:hypothetical protein RMQ65_04220 [Arcobacter sp. AZ-2023]WPD06335.1 hypothetical protein QUR76_03875 [Arcobacter sp. DSM 115956]WPD08426.1 hypothetical protein QUR78_03875 [Arcobacter sp. DSM 115955]WNL32691.1 hypothetical protein RMQ67_03875 [Arcobacter sp. AZ-2023]WNP38841.1 hypothetical protein RJG58_03875 [Arcobacter sp. AZ-2023]